MAGDVVHASAAPKPVGAYPHARRVGGLLFLSGIGPRDPASDAIPGNDYFADGRLRGSTRRETRARHTAARLPGRRETPR